MVKQPGSFSPKVGAMSPHVFTQSPKSVAVEPGIHTLAFETGASRYHDCCIDGGTSPEYFEYHLVQLTLSNVLHTNSEDILYLRSSGML
jgi:hypothetical protein